MYIYTIRYYWVLLNIRNIRYYWIYVSKNTWEHRTISPVECKLHENRPSLGVLKIVFSISSTVAQWVFVGWMNEWMYKNIKSKKERRIQSYVYIVNSTISSQVKDSKKMLSLLLQTKARLPEAFFLVALYNINIIKTCLLLKAKICFLGAHVEF